MIDRTRLINPVICTSQFCGNISCHGSRYKPAIHEYKLKKKQLESTTKKDNKNVKRNKIYWNIKVGIGLQIYRQIHKAKNAHCSNVWSADSSRWRCTGIVVRDRWYVRCLKGLRSMISIIWIPLSGSVDINSLLKHRICTEHYRRTTLGSNVMP